MEPLISVIVPIYKVEEYLSRCVDSIINQTYKNLEIILVDDGSPDDCPKICDDYARKDNRVKVIHKRNGGLSDARNAGMKVATGEYISFIDSDDYISLDFIKVLYDTVVLENSDIVECSVVEFYEDGHFDRYTDDLNVSSCETIEGLSMLISENQFHQHVWNKLYKSNQVLDIPFAVGKLNEDEFWTYQIFGRAKKVTKINKTMYYYFQRESSIMGERYNIRRLDALEGINNRYLYINKNFPSLSLKAKLSLYGACMFAYQSVLKYSKGKEKKIALRKINTYRKKANVSLDDISFAETSLRKYYYLSKINFYLCCKFRSVFGIGF